MMDHRKEGNNLPFSYLTPLNLTYIPQKLQCEDGFCQTNLASI